MQLRDERGKIRYAFGDVWGTKEGLGQLREKWAEYQDFHLAMHGHEVQVDHRSFKDRGIELTPTSHIGASALSMDGRGKPSERVQDHEAERLENARKIRERAEHVFDLITHRQAVFVARGGEGSWPVRGRPGGSSGRHDAARSFSGARPVRGGGSQRDGPGTPAGTVLDARDGEDPLEARDPHEHPSQPADCRATFGVMSRPARRVGRIAQRVCDGFMILGVPLSLTAHSVFGLSSEFGIGLLLVCFFVAMGARVVSRYAMPSEVWREDEAIIANWRGGRIIELLPYIFIPIFFILSRGGPANLHDQFVLGPLRVTRDQLIQTSLVISVGSLWLLRALPPLYRALRSFRVKG